MSKRASRVIVDGLKLANRTGDSTAGQPLVWGVPVPRGAMRSDTTLALRNARNKRIPSQIDVTARWPDGSGKWLLIAAPALEANARPGAEYRIVEADSAPAHGSLLVHTTSGGVHVNTGAIRFTIAAAGPIVPRFETRQSDEWTDRAGPLDLTMLIETQTGRDESSANRHAARQVEVEVAGSQRAVIAVRGMHRTDAGREFGAYTLRFEVFTNSRRVRLTHSVIFDFDTDSESLRASEIVVPFRVGTGERTLHGGDDRAVEWPRRRAEWSADYAFTELYQDSPTHWRLSRWVEPTRREVFGGEGMRCAGWAAIAGTHGSVAAAIRDCWQNHPKSLRIDAAAGEMRIGLYPRRAEPLNMRRYSGLAYMMTYEAPCQWKPEAIPVDPAHNAVGLRKTHEVTLLFDESDIASAATGEQDRPWLVCTQKHLAQTRVFEPAIAQASAPTQRFVHEAIRYFAEARDFAGASGYVDYFDVPLGTDPETGLPLHDFGGLGYINDEAMPSLGLWHAFILTGGGDALDLARAMSRHNADFDSFHAGRWAGQGTRHNVTHWGDQCKEFRISQPIGKRFGYLFEGDRSVVDLVRTILRAFHQQWPKRRWANLVSETAAIVSTTLFAQECGLGDYDRLLRSLADTLAASINEQGLPATAISVDFAQQTACPIKDFTPANSNMASCFGIGQSMIELAERYEHEPLRQAIVRLARFQMLPRARRAELEKTGVSTDFENAARWADVLGYAYALTGDRSFPRHMRRVHRERRIKFVHPKARTRIDLHAIYPPGTLLLRPTPNREITAADREQMMKYYPLWGGELVGLTFWVAVYLHKVRGFMALESPRPRVKRGHVLAGQR